MKIQRGFRHEMRRRAAPSPKAIRPWVRPWREEGFVACKNPPGRGRPQFAHSRTLPECWRLSAAVRGDLQVCALRCEACLIGVFGASCILT